MTDTISITSGTYYIPGATPGPTLCRTLHLTRVTPGDIARASITLDEGGTVRAATWEGRSLPRAASPLLTLVKHTAQIYGQLTIRPDVSPDSILGVLSQDETYAPYIRQNTQQKENH